MVSRSVDELSGVVVDECIRIHRELGPGLLESVYETVLAGALARHGLRVHRQVPVDIDYDGMHFTAAFRLDLLIDKQLILEIKSVESLKKPARQAAFDLSSPDRESGWPAAQFLRRNNERRYSPRREQPQPDAIISAPSRLCERPIGE
jgi:GxxExxY protein